MDEERFFIGRLAERAGVTPDAIRHYEQVGAMPEPNRTPSGYRIYDPTDVDRLGFIRQAQALGLRLDDIAEVLGLVEKGREPCEHVRERLSRRLDETRARMQDLRRLEARLLTALDRAEETGPSTPACRCHIIERTPPRDDGSRLRPLGG